MSVIDSERERMQRFRKVAFLGAAVKGVARGAAAATGGTSRAAWRGAQKMVEAPKGKETVKFMPKTRAVGLLGLGGLGLKGGLDTARKNVRQARGLTEAPWRAQ